MKSGSLLLILVLTSLCLLLSPSYGEQFFVKKKNKIVPIVGVDGFNPIVKEKGKLVTVKKAEIEAREGRRSKPSELSIEFNRSKVVSFKDPKPKLALDLSISSSETIEGAHLFVRTLYSPDGFARLATIASLPKIEATKENEIRLEIPTASSWGSESIEILVFTGERQVKIKDKIQPRRTRIRPNAALPRALFQVDAEKPPEGLLDDAEQAYVKVSFYIDADGKVREASSTDFTHQELVELAIASIKKSKFVPRYKDGEPVRSKLAQTIWFKRSR